MLKTALNWGKGRLVKLLQNELKLRELLSLNRFKVLLNTVDALNDDVALYDDVSDHDFVICSLFLLFQFVVCNSVTVLRTVHDGTLPDIF